MEARGYSALSPGALNGKPPRDFGADRRCACGAKILRYRKGSQCGLCEKNPERLDQVLARKAEEELEMLGRNKWKSKDYPDGCRECDADEKFLRRHASGGLCSLHYQRQKKSDAARAKAAELAEAEAQNMPNGDALDEHLGGRPGGHPGTVRVMQVVDTGIDVEATVGEIEDGKATRTFQVGEDLPAELTEPLACCGAKEAATDDCGGPECEYADRFAEPDTEEDPEWCGVTVVAGLDPEIEALYQIRAALQGIDRDAQLRVVTWALSRFGLDRPAAQA